MLFSIRLAVWSAGRSCYLVSDWLSGKQEDHVV